MSQELVDQLLTEIVSRQEKIKALTEEVADLGAKADLLAGKPEMEVGTLWLEGIKLKAKITRRVNVKFTDKAALGAIMERNKEIADCFNLTPTESGQKLEKWLVTHDDEDAKAIAAIREKTPGKPGVQVMPNV